MKATVRNTPQNTAYTNVYNKTHFRIQEMIVWVYNLY